jgi:hypothetical protein
MDTVSTSKEAHLIDEKMEDQDTKLDDKVATEFKEGGFAGWGTVVGAYVTLAFHTISRSYDLQIYHSVLWFWVSSYWFRRFATNIEIPFLCRYTTSYGVYQGMAPVMPFHAFGQHL